MRLMCVSRLVSVERMESISVGLLLNEFILRTVMFFLEPGFGAHHGITSSAAVPGSKL